MQIHVEESLGMPRTCQRFLVNRQADWWLLEIIDRTPSFPASAARQSMIRVGTASRAAKAALYDLPPVLFLVSRLPGNP